MAMKRPCPHQPSSSNLTCYLAFCESDANRIDSSGIIDPELFGNYIPLKRSQEAAVLAALATRTSQAMKAASEATTWFVLEVSWSPEQVGHFFMQIKLSRCKERDGSWCYRLREAIQLQEAATAQWRKIDVAATGLDAWAERNLYACSKFTGHCADCHGDNLTVRQGGRQGDAWCQPCWHRFLAKDVKEDLHAGLHMNIDS
jgi:mono/diheme cytochrome c family protein